MNFLTSRFIFTFTDQSASCKKKKKSGTDAMLSNFFYGVSETFRCLAFFTYSLFKEHTVKYNQKYFFFYFYLIYVITDSNNIFTLRKTQFSNKRKYFSLLTKDSRYLDSFSCFALIFE